MHLCMQLVQIANKEKGLSRLPESDKDPFIHIGVSAPSTT